MVTRHVAPGAAFGVAHGCRTARPCVLGVNRVQPFANGEACFG
jgi:hypothetical protein